MPSHPVRVTTSRFHPRQGLDDASSPVCPVGSERFSGLFATPRSLTRILTLARPPSVRSPDAILLPSTPLSACCRLSLEFPREVLTLTVPVWATGPVVSSGNTTPASVLDRCTPAFFAHGLPTAAACALACAQALAAPLCARHSTLHLKDGAPSLSLATVEWRGNERSAVRV
jgi:hypothetical protein